ncbi:response regulator [Pseudoduganella sp. LjRoot289]|uniref:response regulator n=1 Tax=Pseudoduganella sp. LjRoot289 TaxID=3342314 RepID=UPI003ECE91A8
MTADRFPFAVRLIGFPEAQAEALAAALEGAPQTGSGPAYFCLSGDSLQEPDLIIANGTDLAALAALAALSQGDTRPVLLIGAPYMALPYPNLRVPYEDDSLYAELAQLVERRADALARLAGAGLPPLPERRASERLDFDLTDPADYAAMRRPGKDRRGAVLVVDRNARFSEHVAKLLKPYNIASLWASDEASALAACADAPQMAAPVAVVLINTSLPDIDPYALCAALRAQAGQAEGVPAVVFLVSRGYAYDSARAGAAGAAGLLDKPVSDATLRAVLKKLMRIA